MTAAGRRAGTDSQPYGVGPLDTSPPPGYPLADPSMARGFSSDEILTIPKSPPKQIVRPSAALPCLKHASNLLHVCLPRLKP